MNKILLLVSGAALAAGTYYFTKKINQYPSPPAVDNKFLTSMSDFVFSQNGKIISASQNNLDVNRFFLKTNVNLLQIPMTDFSIKSIVNEISLLSRISYAEAGDCSYLEKIGVVETVLNRVNDNVSNSAYYCYNRYFSTHNTIYDVIFNTGFDGIVLPKFYPTNTIKDFLEKLSFLHAISAAIYVYFKKTNFFKGALYFSIGASNPCSNSFFEVKIENQSFKHHFYAPQN